ncbi:MAG: hypothetical protein DRP27_06425 [Thermotogae bacterium]|nr:MAG: hypothetical protein DRP27_06425 [Thermotogota bacterium]
MPYDWKNTEPENPNVLRFPLFIAFLSGGLALLGPFPRFALLCLVVLTTFKNYRLTLAILLGLLLIFPAMILDELPRARGNELVGTVLSAGKRYLIVGDTRILVNGQWQNSDKKVRVLGKNQAHPGDIVHVVVREWRTEGAYPKTSSVAERIASFYLPRRFSSILKRKSYTLRNEVASILDEYLTDVSYIARGIVLGEKDEQMESFKKIGVAHFFAVSGFHVYLLAGLLLIPLRLLMISRKWRIFIPVVFLWIYLWIIDFPASAVRAVGMITLYGIFKSLDYPVEPLNILGAVGLANLVFNPEQILSVSFLLSYTATFGILTVGRNLSKRIKQSRWNFILQGIVFTFAAQTAILPISAMFFGSVHPYAFLATMLLAWLVPFIMVGGIFLLIFHFVGITWLAKAIAGGTELLGLTIYKTVNLFDRMPLNTIPVQSYAVLYLLLIVSLSASIFFWHEGQIP